MKEPRALILDFAAAPRRIRGAWSLCLLGLAAVTVAAAAFDRSLSERSRLEAAIESLSSHRRPQTQDPARAKEEAEAGKMIRELAIPWTALLAEIESAGMDLADKVSVLQVEPDADKHIVRITAEVRSLPDALIYLERLQQSTLLRYPLLESHERLKDDPEHPVRIKLVAEWRT